MLSKIISGGQTGADRAALDAALELAFPIGGSCPVGGMAEDGPINDGYTLTEIGGGYRQRTKQNIIDSDGTAIFYESYVGGGTETTVLFCIRQNKPYKLIDIALVEPLLAAELLGEFVRDFNVSVLNVAGPRSGNCPAIYDHVKRSVGLAIQQLT
ncbi:YpsA SLOG family protein [Marinobacter sp. SS21]|uniref:YpsA SLOG family protein n=1 Tax=Marinobacter sp. SS21 TaxID=2979460 RepID=UPI00232A7B0E|nr:putative molybdenum carrier protein [Marinobacter sp. SS21]MDC0663573.1 putative molybdenum carrier protein [Marinobacter sp. SS21]